MYFRTLSEPAKGNVFSNYGKHMLLKTISVVAATPLICAGYMLRVQVFSYTVKLILLM